MKLQIKGLSIVGVMLLAAGMIIGVFFNDMADNALMGASPKYKPTIPVVHKTDITKAPQCVEGYEKTWVGCQPLVE